MSNKSPALEILPQLEEREPGVSFARLNAFIDTPLWVLTLWPLWVFARLTFSASFDLQIFTLTAAYIIGRRWGMAGVMPLGLACLPFTFTLNDGITGMLMPGGLWTIPAVMLAFRLGQWRDLPTVLANRKWSAADHAALAVILLAGGMYVTAFELPRRILTDGQTVREGLTMGMSLHLNPRQNFLLVLAVVFGLSNIRLRSVLISSVTVAVFSLLTATFWPVPEAFQRYLDVYPGIWPVEVIRFLGVIFVLRWVRTSAGRALFFKGAAVLAILCLIYVLGISLRMAGPNFYELFVERMFLAPRFDTVSGNLVRGHDLVVAAALLVWAGLVGWRQTQIYTSLTQRTGLVAGLALPLCIVLVAFQAGGLQDAQLLQNPASWSPTPYTNINIGPSPFVFTSGVTALLTGTICGALIWAFTGQINAQPVAGLPEFSDTLQGRRSVFVAMTGRLWIGLAAFSVLFSWIYMGIAFSERLRSEDRTFTIPATATTSLTAQQSVAQSPVPNTGTQDLRDLVLNTREPSKIARSNALPAFAAAGNIVYDGAGLTPEDWVASLAASAALDSLQTAAFTIVSQVPQMRDTGAFFVSEYGFGDRSLYVLGYGRFENAGNTQAFCDAISWSDCIPNFEPAAQAN